MMLTLIGWRYHWLARRVVDIGISSKQVQVTALKDKSEVQFEMIQKG